MKTTRLITYLFLSSLALNSWAEELFTVGYQNQADFIQLDAVVEAEQMLTLSAQTSGVVDQMLVDAGSHVKAGQPLLSIDGRTTTQQLQASKAQLAAAETQVVQSKAEFARAQQQLEIKAISQSTFDQTKAAYQSAQAQLNIQQAGLKQAQIQQGYTQISAPSNWVVSQRLVEKGELVAPGKPLLSGFNPEQLRVVAHIPQQQREAIQKEAKIQVDKKWLPAGEVTILPTADSRTHSFEVRVNLTAKQTEIQPGMFVKLHLATGGRKRISIPQQAIIKRSEVTAVYVKSGDKYQLRQIRIGATDEKGNVTLLSGLKEGEQISLSPLSVKLR